MAGPISRAALFGLLMLSVLSAAACGDDAPVRRGRSLPLRTSTTTTEAGGASTTGTGPQAAAGFSTTEQSTPPRERGLLRAVRAARQPDGTERVVFEFEGAVPGYRVGYVERPVREDGSGEEVTVDGAAVLQVHFEPASGVDLSGSEMRTVYQGPRRLDLATTTIVDVVRITDFEANLDWAIGLDSKVAFAVSVVSQPGRVVVDVQPSPGAARPRIQATRS